MKFLQRIASHSPLLLVAVGARSAEHHDHTAARRQIDGLVAFAYDESIREQLQRLHDVHGLCKIVASPICWSIAGSTTEARKYFG
jgi:hypothetical protein